MKVILLLILFTLNPITSSLFATTIEGDFFREAYIEQSAAKYGLPSDLVRAVIMAESEFRPYVESYCKYKDGVKIYCTKPRIQRAHGLMQIMPETAWGKSNRKGQWVNGECADLFQKNDFDGLFDERKNIECGSRYLSKMIKSGGSVTLGLVYYNAGLNRTKRNFNKPPTRQSALYYPKVLRIWGEYINAAKT